jgi:hypothetical protein
MPSSVYEDIYLHIRTAKDEFECNLMNNMSQVAEEIRFMNTYKEVAECSFMLRNILLYCHVVLCFRCMITVHTRLIDWKCGHVIL